MLEARSGGCEQEPVRVFRVALPKSARSLRVGRVRGVCRVARTVALLIGFNLASTPSKAVDRWGGSVALSSDYYVRGISRTSDDPALQLELHYSSPSGFVAGVFASNAQIDRREPKDVELSGFIGFAWNVTDDWRGKILASHYAYPWNRAGALYNYDEFDLDVAYQGWLHFSLGYSPNSPRFIAAPYNTFVRVTEKSAEVSLQRPIFGKFSAAVGVGYSVLGGQESGGYAYWSGGIAYDWQPVTLALTYVNTSPGAKALFYNAAATG
ncbi:MAG TPA: TorF family putative porin, partial [Steroidobacteraceae bacterium]